MTLQEILEKFNKNLLENSWWKRFVNSQFITMFSVLGSQIIYASHAAADKALTEGFISLATKRSSILAAAEDKGYVPRLVIPSNGECSVRNTTDMTISLSAYMPVTSDAMQSFMIMDPLELAPGEIKSGVRVCQQEVERLTIPVTKATEFLSIMLTKELTARCAKIDTYVTSGDALILWEANPQFRLSKRNSRHYVLFYRPTEQIGIRFGDGSVGMMPEEGENVVIDVWLSDGDTTLVQGQKLTPAGDFSSLSESLEIITETPVTNGAGYESTEETRNRAQYYVAYDDQVVWRADYKHFLRTVIPNISWVNVWGEKQQEEADGFKSLQNINTVFICAHKASLSQEQMKSAVLSAISRVPNELNKNFKYVSVNERPFTIELTGTVKQAMNLLEAEKKIKDVLEVNAGRNSTSFDKDNSDGYTRVSHNSIWKIVESTGLLSEFKINIINMADELALNDFVYLNAKASTVKLSFGGANAN